MAGHQDGQRIALHPHSDGSRRAGFANSRRQFSVADCYAEWNGRRRAPDPSLELSADGDGLPKPAHLLTGKVSLQEISRCADEGDGVGIVNPRAGRLFPGWIARQQNLGQSAILRDEPDLSNRRVNIVI